MYQRVCNKPCKEKISTNPEYWPQKGLKGQFTSNSPLACNVDNAIVNCHLLMFMGDDKRDYLNNHEKKSLDKTIVPYGLNVASTPDNTKPNILSNTHIDYIKIDDEITEITMILNFLFISSNKNQEERRKRFWLLPKKLLCKEFRAILCFAYFVSCWSQCCR